MSPTEQIPVDPDNPYPLGRHKHHDPRNRQHRALDVPVTEVPARTTPWPTDWIGNQGITPPVTPAQAATNPSTPPAWREMLAELRRWPEGTCTNYAMVGLLRTTPHRGNWSRRYWGRYDSALERIIAYLIGQEHYDPWAGSEITQPFYEGSSTDAPAKLMRDRGEITGWKWLFGSGEVKYHLQHRGPVAVGTVWKSNMFNVDSTGTMDVSGQDVGGHAYRLTFYDRNRNRYLKVGSWGPYWGVGGRAWIPAEPWDHILDNEGGEAVVVEGIR
jgi:hypothetical protein